MARGGGDDASAPTRGPPTGHLKQQQAVVEELRKENFSLKLRIYHMEQQMLQMMPEDSAEAMQNNIKLKVELEAAHRELEEKNALLIKAQHSIEVIAQNFEGKIHTLTVTIGDLRHELSRGQGRLADATKHLGEAKLDNEHLAAQNKDLTLHNADLDHGVRASRGADVERDRATARMESGETEVLRLREALRETQEALTRADQNRTLIKTQQDTIDDWRARYQALEERVVASAVDPKVLTDIKAKDATIQLLRDQLMTSSQQVELKAAESQSTAAASGKAALQASEDAATITELRLELSKLKQVSHPSDELLQTKDATISQLRSQILTLGKTNEALRKVNPNGALMVSQLAASTRQATDGAIAATAASRDKDATIADLELMLSNNHEATSRLVVLQSELVAKNDLVRSLQDDLVRARSEITMTSRPVDTSGKDQVIQDLTAKITELAARPAPKAGPTAEELAQSAAFQEQKIQLAQLENMVLAMGKEDEATAKAAEVIAGLQLRLTGLQTKLSEAAGQRDALSAAAGAKDVSLRSKDRIIQELTDSLTTQQARKLELEKGVTDSQQQDQVLSFMQSEIDTRDVKIQSMVAELEDATATKTLLDDMAARAKIAEVRARSAEQRAHELQSKLARGKYDAHQKDEMWQQTTQQDWNDANEQKARATDMVARAEAQVLEKDEELEKLRNRLRAEEGRADEAMLRMRNNDSIIRRVQQTADEATLANAKVNQDLTASRNHLHEKVEELLSERQITDNQVAQQRMDLEESQRRVRELEDMLASLRDENTHNAARGAMVKTLEGDLQSARASEKRLADALRQVQVQHDQLQRDMSKIAIEATELRNQNVSLDGEVRMLRTVSAETEENDSILIRDLQTKVDRLRMQLEDEEENVRRLRDGFVEKETAVRKCERAHDASKAMLDEQQQHIVHLANQLHSAETEIETLNSRLAELDLLANENSALAKALDDLANDVGGKEAALLEAERAHSELALQVHSADLEIQHLRSQVETIPERDRENARLLEDIRELGDVHARELVLKEAEQNLNILLNERESTIRELTGTLNETTANLAAAQLKMTLTPVELEALEIELERTRRDVMEARDREGIAAEELRNVLDTKERITEDLTKRCAEYAQTIVEHEGELAQLHGIAEVKIALETEAHNLAKACEGLSVQLEKSRTEATELAHKVAIKENELGAALEEQTILFKEREAFAAELDHQTIARGELIGKFNRLEERSSELERAVVATEAERDVLREQLRTATADAESAHRQLVASDADRSSLRERSASLQATLNDQAAVESVERERATQAIRTLQRDRDELDARLAECEADNEKLAGRIRATVHERERTELQHHSAVNEFRLAAAANEQQSMQFATASRRAEELGAQLHGSETRRAQLEADIHVLREDNTLLAARLESAAQERAMLAQRLDAGMGLNLQHENRMLRESLAETTALAEQLREQLLAKTASREDAEKRSMEELQNTLRLLRSTKTILQEEDRRRVRESPARRGPPAWQRRG